MDSPGAGTGGVFATGGSGNGGKAGGGDAGAISGGNRGGDSSGGSASVGGGGAAGAPTLTCDSPEVPNVPLRRLNAFEYDNTLRDLLAVTMRPASALSPEQFPGGDESALTNGHVEGYHELAHTLASALSSETGRLEALIACDPALDGEERCKERVLDELVPLIFRAPLEASVRAEMDAVFDTGAKLGGGFASGARAVLEVALQSPEFLYRVELGRAAPGLAGGIARLAPYEMATRLSYFLTGSAPDPALLDAAARDELGEKEQVAEQARRLLAKPGAREVVRYFHLEHLGLRASPLDTHVALGSDLMRLMVRETEAFLDDVTFEEGGDLRTLLTAPFTFVNRELADFYGIEAVTGDEFQKVALAPGRRGGLLTQGIFLSSTSNLGISNPSKRGNWVLKNLLCTDIPLHPGPPQPPPFDGQLTTRERFERSNGAAVACAACHSYFDSMGFGLEHFDSVGLFRDSEVGKPIDASGSLSLGDAQGSFDGAVELAALLAGSGDVQNCYAEGWLNFAYGRRQEPMDECSLAALRAAFEGAKGNVRELLVAVTQTDGFLYRAKDGAAP